MAFLVGFIARWVLMKGCGIVVGVFMAGWVGLGAAGCEILATEDPGSGKSVEAHRTSAVSAAKADGCSLLDDAHARRRMSGALALGWKHKVPGRLSPRTAIGTLPPSTCLRSWRVPRTSSCSGRRMAASRG